MLRLDPLEPDDPVHPLAPYRPPTLALEPELDEELDRGLEVLNHDADVVHPLDRHAVDRKEIKIGG